MQSSPPPDTSPLLQTLYWLAIPLTSLVSVICTLLFGHQKNAAEARLSEKQAHLAEAQAEKAHFESKQLEIGMVDTLLRNLSEIEMKRRETDRELGRIAEKLQAASARAMQAEEMAKFISSQKWKEITRCYTAIALLEQKCETPEPEKFRMKTRDEILSVIP